MRWGRFLAGLAPRDRADHYRECLQALCDLMDPDTTLDAAGRRRVALLLDYLVGGLDGAPQDAAGQEAASTPAEGRDGG